MKTIQFKKYGIVVLFTMIAGCMISASTESWVLVDSESGINMYERWVSVNNDLRVRERKGEMTINGSLNEVLSVLTDPAKTNLWMNHVSSAYMIRKVSDQAWYSYTYFALPWPFDNRDMIAFSNLNYNQDHTLARIEMTSRETTIPLKPGAKRLNNYKATWELRKAGNSRTKIIFQAVSFNPPEYPRIIQDKVMRGTFMDNLVNLKGLIEH
jgi:hypothetical protein